MTQERVVVFRYGRMVLDMRVTGVVIRPMDVDVSSMLMGMSTREIGSMIKLME